MHELSVYLILKYLIFHCCKFLWMTFIIPLLEKAIEPAASAAAVAPVTSLPVLVLSR